MLKTHSTLRQLLISWGSALVFNTAIAGLLTLVSFETHFVTNLIFSQCIGLSLYATNLTVMRRVTDPRRRWLILSFSFPGSILLGVHVAAQLTGCGDWSDPRAWIAVVIGLFFGGIGFLTFLLSERIERLDAEVRQRRMAEMESEKRQIEAHLKLLQAQIEPHFLFNALANVGGLIDSDPPAARRLLDRLNDWLRVALARARSEQSTLGDELEMLDNYLHILGVRFGPRLRWRIEADETARRLPFPPMLLQPLVENAVHHGIEPNLNGGEIAIRADLAPEALRVEVRDNGAGLPMESASQGTGLGNVRARLSALFGAAGQLRIDSPGEGGVVATLQLPR